jgi:dienelactone hydrolase
LLNLSYPLLHLFFIGSDANGVNDYEQLRAVMIAEEFGFVGFAADIYGIDLHNVTDRAQRDELLDLYRLNATLYTERIQAAIDLVASFETVDADNIAIIGYCFGGTGVLTYSLSGLDSVKAAVSFHGGLATIPAAGPVIVPKILVLSGGEDDMSTDIVDLEETLNSVNASWEITRYSGIEHAFTVFGDDRYNEWADMRSWESMRGFLEEALAKMPFESQQPDAVTVEDVPYTDIDGAELQGYLSLPGAEWESPYPTVVILP